MTHFDKADALLEFLWFKTSMKLVQRSLNRDKENKTCLIIDARNVCVGNLNTTSRQECF